jgi:hypothetical protein
MAEDDLMRYLNLDCLGMLDHQAFRTKQPYPWIDIQGSLTREAFDRLRETLPDVSLFHRDEGGTRGHGQAYHDRYLLHYQPDLPLAAPWKEFIAELKGKGYQDFLCRMLDRPPSRPRIILTMEWYYGWRGCGVSPHCDARRKLATHILYFNTQEDWQTNWGGRILIMDDQGQKKPHSAPSFDQLGVAASIDPRGNGSLLFKRTERSWHGVRPLECPPGNLRKLFLVTINAPTLQVLWRRLRGKDPDGHRIRAA